MNLKEQLQIQRMYDRQANVNKTALELKEEDMLKLKKEIKKQKHIIKGTQAAKVGNE